MKALMRSYIYWYGIDKEIENLVKTCKNCALTAKAPPVKFNLWPKTDKPWSKLHINYCWPNKGDLLLHCGRQLHKVARSF